MVAQVGGQVRVHARRPDLREEAVAGAAAHRDAADRGGRVAGHPQAGRGRGQPARGLPGELGEAQRLLQHADPAEPAAPRGVGRVRHERPGDPQPHRRGERVGDAGVGAVGVGMGHVEGDAAPDQVVDDPALEAGRADRCDRGRTAQIQRVVRDEEPGAGGDRLVHDLLHGVHGEDDPGDLGRRVAAHQPHGVPALGQGGGPQGVEGVDEVG